MQPQHLSMQGKVCLITGATSGIGAITARALAAGGATTVLVGRNAEKGAAAARQISAETGNPAVACLTADLAVQAQIRRLADEFHRRYARLDVLVNNAGAMLTRRQESVEGIELTLALNHLGPFLLTQRLLETLRASAPARIVNVSSNFHALATLDWQDLQSHKRYFALTAYNRSKLANLLFTYELARRLAGTGVTANAAAIGFTRTGLYRRQNLGLVIGGLCWLMLPFARSAEDGARTVIHLATAPALAQVSGQYFEGEQAIPSSPASYRLPDAARLWAASAALTGLAPA